MELTLEQTIKLLLKKIWFIVISIFAGLCVCYLISSYVMKPSYTASVQMYVNPNDTTSSANLNELNYAQKVVNTYIGFLQTKDFYSKIARESNLAYTPDYLKRMTTIEAVNNTEIFEISVTTNDPMDSFRLVEVMQDMVPVHIKNIKDTSKISIVDPVVIPTSPSSPNIILNTIIGGFIGLFGSVFLIILWEMFDVRVKSQEELAKRYQIPVLGVIPNFDKEKKKKITFRSFLSLLKRSKKSENEAICLNENTKFIITEAYKSFRTNLRFALRGNGCKKIVINSPNPEDGKSTTSVNLAITIAQTGSKVLLMDCDLRKGRIHSFTKVRSAPGISDALSGMVSENDVIQETKYKNLHVMSMGTIPPNPNELLVSVQMEEVLAKLEKVYDYILMDSPPINVVSDALSLVKLSSGVIIVVREGITTYPNIVSALNKYSFANANILGFVMNGVSFQHHNKKKSNYYYRNYKDKND
ncbi:polysaccharide biosynthesis tyrosine autokinase [Mobilitalea sibirica]|uniref:non-specific protein-tyrosine kinase n=1 Tax=Mobilitalea sibirica TaxID=1462919 RepID=A0A8J7KVP5_9FIRM|nr:polysaccharide biosynthesis tyrosine autokinase [Mobilitalea sibirica]MBH1939402.1 polysaccharide biosynthesis tyrosine autokinase [Mobilitalea sibirica]